MGTIRLWQSQTNKVLFKDQFDDEEVLDVFRRHPVVMRNSFGRWLVLAGPLYIPILRLYLPQMTPPSTPPWVLFTAVP